MSRSEAGVTPTIVMGTFDPETRWRDLNLAKLPAMPDKDRESIVLCMDELLFPFCGPDDILYSRCKIDPGLYEYLNGLGFYFRSRHHFDLSDAERSLPEPDLFKQCMFSLALDGQQREEILIHNVKQLSPYAITADTEEYLHAAGLLGSLPDHETVKRVNSKFYSNRLLSRIGEKCYGTEVNSALEVQAVGNTLLNRGAYLLKDPFGVSGKGNMLIENEAMQRRIAEHLEKQERRGLHSQFLLEPLLRKETDFSSHWFIRESGETDFISVQRMLNQQQNYGGSIRADEAMILLLRNAGYFDTMEKALRILSEDGYHGFVCFDSMILEGGDVVPIVEINARKSMGLINAYLDKGWETYGHTGLLTFLSLGLPEGFAFGRLLDALHISGLLFTGQGAYGIVPLSSNTVMVNDILTSRRITEGVQSKRGMPKGRLYFSVVGRDDEHRSELIVSLRQVLADLSIKVYN
ncbi:hypothetical protein QP794_05270 [Paenibacillus sp. UMB7766-LJ446]|uniref:hypothetical protein n=1 Tax=Paenibacillus sp. UMB7766-LJ446 TaxID=3046313 RepID=UPI00254D6849|nr:hypothetical protein [Paenibacillus sp. UMB7766-LJ446]MDK8189490.1 hypothetical protein [Paenibacillus sp. UMB7766-LJ446]